ncbi:MAG: hypothetical protein H6Q75_500 [Firmicutes bacterium]|nr:hypothetical protein [Bacillota bacterium]
MKKKNLILLLFACLLFIVQAPAEAAPAPLPSGFLGATWGDGMQQVIYKMENNGYEKKDQGIDYVTFTGLFSGEPVEVRTEFLNDSLYFGSMLFSSSRTFDPLVLQDKYDKTKKMLTDKYGKPNKSQKDRWLKESNWTVVKNGLRVEQVSIVLRGESPWYAKPEDRNRRGSVVVYFTNESLKSRLLNKQRELL